MVLTSHTITYVTFSFVKNLKKPENIPNVHSNRFLPYIEYAYICQRCYEKFRFVNLELEL